MKNWIFPVLFALLFLAIGCGNDAPKSAPSDSANGTQQPAASPEKAAEPSPADTTAKSAAVTPKTDTISPSKKGENASGMSKPSKAVSMSEAAPVSVAPRRKIGGLDAANWTEVTTLDKRIMIDIRYATENNFTKSKIYDCPRCFLRPEAAQAIAKANDKLQKERGFALKMFDCYRPRPYQQRLWDKVPDANYVTPPQKGSMHSRGAAVDLTIVDKKGKELDMGTTYDFFGEKAHADFLDLPENVLENRKLLKKTMESVGFKGIRTEWWHFSFGKKEYGLSSDLWECVE